jgi:hypothetical protein
MGWLFAVGRGLQLRDRRAVYRALGPLAAGHALSIAVAVGGALALGQIISLQWLRWLIAATLVAVGITGLASHRHISLGGMRVSSGELATWSFLVATIHGAGLMVLPFVLGAAAPIPMSHARHAIPMLAGEVPAVDSLGLLAPVVHTAGYLAVTALLAIVVYEKVGVRILRRAWINLNVLWAAALIGVGGLTLLL